MSPAFLPTSRRNRLISDDDLQPTNRADLALTELRSFSEECSVLGFRPAMDPERSWFRRLMWTVLVLGGIALALYQIQSRVGYYASFPTSSSFSTQLADSLPFPQVTICNENRMMKNAAATLGFEKVLPAMFPSFQGYPPVDISFIKDRNYTQQQWEEIRFNLSQPRDKTFPYGVGWGKESFNDTTTVITSVWTNMGLCYAFNAGEYKEIERTAELTVSGNFEFGSINKEVILMLLKDGHNFTTTVPGAIHGVYAVLHTIQSAYLVSNSPAAGFRMLIHDQQEMPLMLESSFHLSTGSVTTVSFTLEQKTELGPPYSSCNDSAEYNLVNCKVVCQRDILVRSCGCRLNYMPGIARSCTIIEEYECVNPLMSSPDFIQNLTQAVCYCPRQCRSRVFQSSVTSSVMSESFISFIVNANNGLITPSTLVNDYLGFQVYYSSLQYTDLSTSASYDVMALLSDVGGALGLMLGATLITIFEVAEFLFQLSLKLMNMQSHEKKAMKEENKVPFTDSQLIRAQIPAPLANASDPGGVIEVARKINVKESKM